jgi:hypothetical protein
MPVLYPFAAISLGLWSLIAAASLVSAPWLAIGLLAIACGTRDLLRLDDVSLGRAAAYVLDCVLLLAILLVLSLCKPFASDAPHELD